MPNGRLMNPGERTFQIYCYLPRVSGSIPGLRLPELLFAGAEHLRPLKNVQFCWRSSLPVRCPQTGKTKILTAGIHWVFWGLKFESDPEIEQKWAFCKGLKS